MTKSIDPTPVSISARDGYALSGTVYPAQDPRGAVVINGATGVPHRFYRRFATALAEAGHTTLAWDYRGIGASRPLELRGFEARMRDWVLLDMPGVIDWATTERHPDRLFLVGHSFGGQVAGMLDNGERTRGMVTFSSQSGYWRRQGGEQKLAVAFHAHIGLPLLAKLLGYVPMSWFSSGEDLPRGVAEEWARWCRHPKYLLGDDTLPLDRYQAFRAPVLAYSFGDDKWGTPEAVDAMMQAYPNLERRHVEPSAAGLPSIGHVGFFRPAAQHLWKDVVAWLDEH